MIIPNKIPKITVAILVISNASGIKSKQIMASIKPDANAKIKLKNFLDCFLHITPNMPPMVVPNVPKNNPMHVVFMISLITSHSPYSSFIFFSF